MRFENKCAIVTGAGRGIGRAAALLFAREGAKPIAADVNGKGLKELEQGLKAAGAEYRLAVCDISDEAAARRLGREAVEAFGKVDVLVNNAGIYRDQLNPSWNRAASSGEGKWKSMCWA